MSKSKNNGVDPQELINKYGADTVRLYVMFTSPPDQSLEWNDTAVEGSFRFLKRLWKLATQVINTESPQFDVNQVTDAQKDIRRKIHETIHKVNDDIGRRYTFNTAIAAIMELMNAINKDEDNSDNGKAIARESLETIVCLLSPIVPHVTEVIWRQLGHAEMVVDAPWPVADENIMSKETIKLVIQVNGKKRSEISVNTGADDETIRTAATQDEHVQRFIEGKEIRKIIIVPGRLVNIVIS